MVACASCNTHWGEIDSKGKCLRFEIGTFCVLFPGPESMGFRIVKSCALSKVASLSNNFVWKKDNQKALKFLTSQEYFFPKF